MSFDIDVDLEEELDEPIFWPLSRKELQKAIENPVHETFIVPETGTPAEIKLEQVKVSSFREYYIKKILKEFKDIPYNKKMLKGTFKLILEKYIEDPEERERFFIDNPDKWKKFAKAYDEVRAVYERTNMLGGLPYDMPPRVVYVKGKEDDKTGKSWPKKNKNKLLGGILSGIIGLSAGLVLYNQFFFET